MNNLITFGDSWVWGVGAGFSNGMTKAEYGEIAWDESYLDRSFRKLLSQDHGAQNKNFSSPGSSNQRQIRLASDFFIKHSKFFTKNKDRWSNDVIVLWGLTSVYRTELFDVQSESYFDQFIPGNKSGLGGDFGKIYGTKYFNETVETEKLYYHVELFNYLFREFGIKNYWFNIFNEHQFPKVPDKMLFNGRSLLSLLIDTDENDDSYHMSDWTDTDWKIKKAKDMGLVNPHSGHPTQAGHLKIFKCLIKELGDLG
jgi:hypothetical protein